MKDRYSASIRCHIGEMVVQSVQVDRGPIIEFEKLVGKEERPPVIGQEEPSRPLDEVATTTRLMHSDTLAAKPPPPLPPKPTMGVASGVGDDLKATEPVELPKASADPESGPGQSDDKVTKAVSESSPHQGTTGSETSRSFQPEGSVDLSPTCSESLPTTPNYLKWAESMQYLLDDADGCNQFKAYLDQQNLGHLLEFVLAVKGFKIQMVQQNADADLQLRLIKTINKRYVNSLGKDLSSRIDCLFPEQRKVVDDKVTTRKGLDANVFDGARQTVEEHLESKCYPNFLTSDVYIEYVQAVQQLQESDVTSSRYSAATASSASSMSGHPRSSVNPGGGGPGADDSGISGITQSDKVSSGPPGPIPPLEAAASKHSPNSCKSHPGTTIQDSPDLGPPSTSSLSHSLLPTVKEDSELSLGSSMQHNKSSGARPKRTAGVSSSTSSLNRSGITEVHPNMTSLTSYPYHAHSSNWNPVSRQDSELQSQSSGAVGGDTTDDNYSSTYPDLSTLRPHQLHLKPEYTRRPPKVIHRSSDQPPTSYRNRPDSHTQFIPRPRIPSEPANIAHNPDKFAHELISKLSKLEHDQASSRQLSRALERADPITKSGYARQNQQQQQQLDYSGQDLESDQSILDEHVDRVFKIEDHVTKQHNVSSSIYEPSGGGRGLSASFHAGYRTLEGPSRNRSAHFGHTAASHSQYRGGSNPTVAGDLAYYPAQSKGVPKSYSDTDFAGPPSHGRVLPGTFGHLQQHYPSQGTDRVSDWVKTTAIHSTSTLDNAVGPGFKTSPKTSGRHTKRTRSQDRFGVLNPPTFTANTTYTGFMDPTNPALVVNEASRRLASARHASANVNASLPVVAATHGFTTARYTFPQSKDTTPFLIRIPRQAPVKLGDVKQHMPKKGAFRFYFKTEMDGEEVFQEETNDMAFVPMWKGSVVVQCNVE